MFSSPNSVRVVAEAGSCNGSVAYAKEAASAAREAGCWGFKVQMFRSETLVLPGTPRYDNLGGKASTQDQAFAGALPYHKWAEVADHCRDIGIEFFASVFDDDAVAVAESIGVRLYKIASGDITNRPLIERVAATGKQMIVSTGGATAAELVEASRWVGKDIFNGTVWMACTLSYPAANVDANLARIGALQIYGAQKVGYSDHTVVSETALGAVMFGARVLEKHFTITPSQGGDHDFGLNPGRMARYVQFANNGLKMRGSGLLEPLPVERRAVQGARRSLVAVRDIAKGEKLTPDMFVPLRPAGGMPPSELRRITGTDGRSKADRAMVEIPAGTVLQANMVGKVGGTLTVE